MKIEIFATSLLLLSCAQVSIPKAGTKLVSPFSLAISGNSLYVADAAAFGEYSTGSLLVYSLQTDGTKTLKQVVDITPYATQIAALSDLVALGFVGEKSRIELYRANSSGVLEYIHTVNLGLLNSLSSFNFFTYNGQNYLTAAENGNSVHGKTHVWKVSGNSLEKVFTLPDSLQKYGRSELIGYSNAIFDGQRFMAMPSSSVSSIDKISVSAEDFSVASWKNETDLRAFSAVVVDFQKLSSDFDNAVAYVPMIVQKGDTSSTKAYRTFFSYAAFDPDALCGSKIYLADDSNAMIWQTSGLENISNAAYSGTTLVSKVASNISINKYFDMSTETLSPSFTTNVRSMGFIKSAGTCTPFWLRSEARGSSEGNARAWLEGIQNGTRFFKEFGVRGVVSSVSNNEYVYSTSFSNSALPVVKFNSGNFEDVQ